MWGPMDGYLVNQGKILDAEAKVEDYDIRDMSTLRLCMRMRGGVVSSHAMLGGYLILC